MAITPQNMLQTLNPLLTTNKSIISHITHTQKLTKINLNIQGFQKLDEIGNNANIGIKGFST